MASGHLLGFLEDLVGSFAMKHGGEMPGFVGYWVTYGLPIAGLVVGGLFYVVMRLDPDAARADDDAELGERFARVKHNARLEVMASPQMKAVIRQMMWQQLPPIIGRQMNLSEQQIAALTGQAPQLLDLNGNGVGDIQEQQPAAHRQPSVEELEWLLEQARRRETVGSVNGDGPHPTKRPDGR